MPKIKTSKSAAKRFSRSGTGKIMMFRAGKSHLLEHKSSKRTRRLRKPKCVAQSDARKVRRLLPNG
jgi:large subunit ribosomal protein L35